MTDSGPGEMRILGNIRKKEINMPSLKLKLLSKDTIKRAKRLEEKLYNVHVY